MTKKIFFAIFLTAYIIFILSLSFSLFTQYSKMVNETDEKLRTVGKFIYQGVKNEGIKYLSLLSITPYRITWISANGSVLYDNATYEWYMENHLDREEVVDASIDGYGESHHYSRTLTKNSFYIAYRLNDDSILRISKDEESFFSFLLSILPQLLIVMLLTLLLSFLVAKKISQKIVASLNKTDLDHPLSSSNYKELLPLLERLDSQQRENKEQSSIIEMRQRELLSILENTRDAIALINREEKIILMNKSFVSVFSVVNDNLGQNISDIVDEEIYNKIKEALLGKDSDYVRNIGEIKCEIILAPVVSQEAIVGVTLIIRDVTEKENNEKLRRDFSSNVSHELKTPLHVIAGYSELIMGNLVKKEDIPLFAEKINSEAKRMSDLINDIISLSHLDEGEIEKEKTIVDLYAMSKFVIENLTSFAEEKSVTLSLYGKEATIYAVPTLIESVIHNLVSNAINYNKKYGKVEVTTRTENNRSIVIIKDTGIGIAPEEQERIFERFYRVDKSRSKQSGGTGLGLAIVKHAVALHEGTIEVKSILGEGTTMIVSFPKSYIK